ncbi:NUDIX domain-containing protein [Acuticoccus sediminis]|uniref:NUDIX domain-containing protein n=1 Tax=Acuticoccus sediminis TaxID=2184697 RepID=UPI001CFC9911|nr:NUDIX domain-containing protein [Acuticoccus sediminis]
MSASAGVLMYRRGEEGIEVLLVHPGGPFWRRKDDGAWSVPKGLIEPGEDPDVAARREFEEEIGTPAAGDLLRLGTVRQSGGKVVEAFALEGDADAIGISGGGTVEVEWPRGSGRILSFPEVDRAAWLTLPQARVKMLASQRPFLDRLEAHLRA